MQQCYLMLFAPTHPKLYKNKISTNPSMEGINPELKRIPCKPAGFYCFLSYFPEPHK